MSTPPIRIAGVIGDPVAHSKSPAMHNAAFAYFGLPAQYERWHTPLAELPDRINSLRAPHMYGANVTLPHKLAILPLLDEIDDIASQIGAANTIIRLPDEPQAIWSLLIDQRDGARRILWTPPGIRTTHPQH